jgi:hypothetical protein
MPHHEFRIILADADEIVDDMTHDKFVTMANALFEAGCEDGSPGTSGGIVAVDFHREAGSLREAIESAVADVEIAGYRVERVESSDQDVYNAINQRLPS